MAIALFTALEQDAVEGEVEDEVEDEVVDEVEDVIVAAAGVVWTGQGRQTGNYPLSFPACAQGTESWTGPSLLSRRSNTFLSPIPLFISIY